MHVGLITYQAPHKKTLDVTLKLLASGKHEISWFAFPFHKRPVVEQAYHQDVWIPYVDRPAQIMDYDVRDFCKRFSIRYVEVPGWHEYAASWLGWPGERDAPDIFLHCTAKIIPPEWLTGRTVLNCHPGLLPRNRGVDAFKWSIVNGWPVGVTLHAIDEEIDRGIILYRHTIPILSTDKLSDLCERMYAFECDLLARFDAHLHNINRPWYVGDDYPCSHKRIPVELDCEIERIFQERKARLIEAATQPSAAAWPQPHEFNGKYCHKCGMCNCGIHEIELEKVA